MRLSFLLLAITLLAACGEETNYTPKPRAYPRIVYPEKSYLPFRAADCGFTFEYPAYARIVQDSFFFGEKPPHPCWFDLYIPDFDSRLHCSYMQPGQGKSFDELRSDAFDLANWHTKRANYIDEEIIQTPNGVEGIGFRMEGPAATPYQFFLTDPEHKHFLRASLYLNTQIRPDSLQPIYDFLQEDLDRMILSFKWD